MLGTSAIAAALSSQVVPLSILYLTLSWVLHSPWMACLLSCSGQMLQAFISA